MKIICRKCRNEFDWNSDDIFVQPSGYTIDFTCRNCIKETRSYKKNKLGLKK
jgi:hypothetical protein